MFPENGMIAHWKHGRKIGRFPSRKLIILDKSLIKQMFNHNFKRSNLMKIWSHLRPLWNLIVMPVLDGSLHLTILWNVRNRWPGGKSRKNMILMNLMRTFIFISRGRPRSTLSQNGIHNRLLLSKSHLLFKNMFTTKTPKTRELTIWKLWGFKRSWILHQLPSRQFIQLHWLSQSKRKQTWQSLHLWTSSERQRGKEESRCKKNILSETRCECLI